MQTPKEEPDVRVASQPHTAAFNESDDDQEQPSEEEKEETKASLICRLIDSEFEKGLLKFKELVQQEPDLDFDSKQ